MITKLKYRNFHMLKIIKLRKKLMKLGIFSAALAATAFSSISLAESKIYSCTGISNERTILTIVRDLDSNEISKMKLKVYQGWDKVAKQSKFAELDPFNRPENLRTKGSFGTDGDVDIAVITTWGVSANNPRFEYDNKEKAAYFWMFYSEEEKPFSMVCDTTII